MNLYIYSYNNYYNRQVKKAGDLISNYNEWLHYGPIQGVYGFTPGDGVNTKQIIGSNASMYDGKGDYLIAFNPNTNEIDSRWFIIDVTRTRAGQWELTLHRDLMVDYYDLIVDSPMFIEKATLAANSPFIFNSENVQLNEIKKAEYLLENNLKTPWVVAYLSRKDNEGNYNSFSGEFVYNNMPVEPTYEFNSLSEYEFYNLFNTDYKLTDNITFTCEYYHPSASRVKYCYVFLSKNTFVGNYAGGYSPGYENWPIREEGVILKLPNATSAYNSLLSAYNAYSTIVNGVPYNTLTGVGTTDGLNLLANEIGKTIKVGDTIYRITGEIGIADYEFDSKFKITTGTTLYNEMLNKVVIPCGLKTTSSTVLSAYAEVPFEMTKIRLSYEVIQPEKNIAYNFNYNNGAVTTDAVYEIIATPLYNKTFSVGSGASITSQGSFGLQWFQALAQDNATKVYDVQIVPYIPIDDLDISSYEYVTAYKKGTTSEIYALAIKLPKSSFSLLLNKPTAATLHSNVKMGSETELWRITSPNGIGSFDFNPYKNNGWNFIEVDCTLLPINPYIKINPLFNPNGLYGGDYNDYRGLICNGDFSVALTANEWATYQQQNKNFQAVFDREIQSMDLKNKLGKTQDIAGAIAGTLSGAAGGAFFGGATGSIPGAIAGGVVGGIGSAIAGAADISINEQLRNEALDYTKDMFGLNLGNIKARANTLTKTTSFNKNNKYFPYIEFFTCTEEEKKALANKIAWNGMTLGVIGKMNDYIDNSWSYGDIESQGYIKGKLIRLDFPINHKQKLHSEDFHVINAISGELNKGVYIK